jgi:hypothetical protein
MIRTATHAEAFHYIVRLKTYKYTLLKKLSLQPEECAHHPEPWPSPGATQGPVPSPSTRLAQSFH